MARARSRPAATESLEDIYRRPGFMIRRAHQIAVAIFLEEARESRITPTQYGVLVILGHRPGIDQTRLFEGNSVLRGQAPVVEGQTPR